MTSIEALQFASDMFLMGMSAICAIQMFQRREDKIIYLPLGLFFVAQVLAILPMLLEQVFTDPEPSLTVRLVIAMSLPVLTTMAPLFWLYVRMLTSETRNFPPRRALWHILPICVAMVASVAYLLLPSATIAALERGEVVETTLLTWVTIFANVAALVLYLQVLVYLLWTLRILYIYSSRLKDLFASTESRELHWIWWIAIAGAVYWVSHIAQLLDLPMIAGMSPAIDLVLSFADVALIGVVAIWGMRQRPGLSVSETERLAKSQKAMPKYSRSALTDADMSRIASKIGSAMQRDHLYSDPNLSLWDLANHIGVSTNYVSQTLNFKIQRKFFDYVNSFRIRRAVRALLDSDATILSIAFDVGFNSRSSFYRAFRQELGMTPLELRRKWKQEQVSLAPSKHSFIEQLVWPAAD